MAILLELVLTRGMGQTQYGYYSAGLSWLMVLGMASSMGTNQVLMRFLPLYGTRHQHGKAQGLIRWSAKFCLWVGALTGAGLAAVAGISSIWSEGPLPQVLLIMAVWVPLHGFCIRRQGALQGLRHPVLAMLPELLLRPVLVILLVTIVHFLLRQDLTAVWGAVLFGLALALSMAVGQWAWRFYLKQEIPGCKPEPDLKVWRKTAFPLWWMTLMHLALIRADPAMLAWLSGPDEAALFAVASRGADLLVFGLTAISAIAAPVFSQYHAQGKTPELQKMLNLSTLGLAAFSLPVAGVLYLLGPWLLNFFGAGFEDAYGPLCFLLLGQCITALAGPLAFLLTMTGHHALAARLLTFCAAGKLLLNFVFMPKFGAIGGAAATAAMLLCWNLVLARETRRSVGLTPSLLYWLPRKHA